jgi:N-sulfoglucosamine sulfohydrolase
VRPAIELYDLAADPHEQHNLAANPQHAQRLASLRDELEQWMRQQGDKQTVFAEPRRLTNGKWEFDAEKK